MGIGVHNRCVLFYCTLELKNYNGNTVYKYNPVRDTHLIINADDFKLIYRFENVVFGVLKVNQFNENILLGSVLTVKYKTVTEHFIDGLVRFIESAGSITKHKDNAIYFTRSDPIFGITGIEILLQIISKKHIGSFPVDLFTAYVFVAFLFE